MQKQQRKIQNKHKMAYKIKKKFLFRQLKHTQFRLVGLSTFSFNFVLFFFSLVVGVSCSCIGLLCFTFTQSTFSFAHFSMQHVCGVHCRAQCAFSRQTFFSFIFLFFSLSLNLLLLFVFVVLLSLSIV